jgi:CheY-like chemotaxis protein
MPRRSGSLGEMCMSCHALRDTNRAQAAVPPPRVLLVDDERAIVESVGRYLTHRGYDVRCAGNLERASLLLTRLRFAVVVSDLHLGGDFASEGLELCRHVRESYPSTRVVLFTASSAPGVEREASRLGLNAILYKPCPLSRLAGVVDGLVWGRSQNGGSGRRTVASEGARGGRQH